ncbi:MAG: hypothetical protein IJR42_01465 [Paludibacteraceae bacterium]|nr:hypothetical protein [Paludibacteraceae bacterium]
MIRQTINIEQYGWDAYVYMAATPADAPEIIGVLESIGISAAQFMKAERHLQSAVRDSGMTYSSGRTRESVVVISRSTSPEETINTFSHELRHLADDIAEALNIPHRGEEVAYLTGDIACALAGSLLHIACECPKCRNAG